MLLHLVLAAQHTNTDNTPGSPAPAFHAEPRKKKILMKAFCVLLLFLGPSATTVATVCLTSISLLLQIAEVLERDGQA